MSEAEKACRDLISAVQGYCEQGGDRDALLACANATADRLEQSEDLEARALGVKVQEVVSDAYENAPQCPVWLRVLGGLAFNGALAGLVEAFARRSNQAPASTYPGEWSLEAAERGRRK